MARELVTLIWCDKHQQEKDEQVAGRTYEIGAYSVDLCESCAKPVIQSQQLAELYGAKGERTRRQKADGRGTDDPQTCPICGKTAKNRASLGSHGRHMHGMTLGEMEGAELNHPCPHCDRKFSTYQGASVHQRMAHPEHAES